MTPLLAALLVALCAHGVYLAALSARQGGPPGAFLDAGMSLPGWAVAFTGAGVAVAGLNLPEHAALSARFGLQAVHLGMGLILAALALVLVQKRLWLAARILGTGTPGATLGAHYGSVSLRIAMLTLAALFALPWSAHLLSGAGAILAAATGGAVDRGAAVFLLAFGLFLPAVIGGWRALVLALAMQAVLLAVLMIAVAAQAEIVLDAPGYLSAGLPVAEGILPDRIPGVVQPSAGIGKSLAHGGPFTALAILSGGLALVGIVLSPGFLWLGSGARPGRTLTLGPVWLTGGTGVAMLLVAVPFLAARLDGGIGPFAAALAAAAGPVSGAAAAVLFLVATLIGVAFFTVSGALLITRELVLGYILPDLSPAGIRLAARIALGAAFLALAILAAYAPVASAAFAALALPLSVQMLPALLGLAFVRWISRGAVLAGLILGSLLVLFTEPLGLILWEGFLPELPWGRWPYTVHSAAWGLAANVAAVLLVSVVSAGGPERAARDRLHDEFAARFRADFGGRALRGATWSLTLVWAFFALGPGAILGNAFFSRPMFAGREAEALGVPSLWVWQLLFWPMGVMLIWLLAFRAGLGTTSAEGLRPAAPDGVPRRAPDWIAAGLARLRARPASGR